MGLFSRFKKAKKDKAVEPGLPMYLYDDSEIEVIDNFICDMFGNYKNVSMRSHLPTYTLMYALWSRQKKILTTSSSRWEQALTKWRSPRSGRSISWTTRSM